MEVVRKWRSRRSRSSSRVGNRSRIGGGVGKQYKEDEQGEVEK